MFPSRTSSFFTWLLEAAMKHAKQALNKDLSYYYSAEYCIYMSWLENCPSSILLLVKRGFIPKQAIL